MEMNVKELYDYCNDTKLYDSGSSACVYEYNGLLLKINKDLLRNVHSIADCEKNLRSIKDDELNRKYEKMQQRFMALQKGIKYTQFARDLFYCNGVYLGVLLHKFEGYNEYDNGSKIEMLRSVKKALINNRELVECGIYHLDLCPPNVLVKNDDVQFIDIDGPLMKYSERGNKRYAADTYRILLDNLFFALDMDNRCCGNVDFERANEIVDELQYKR